MQKSINKQKKGFLLASLLCFGFISLSETLNASIEVAASDCAAEESEIIIEVMTDQYPQEISWTLSTNGTTLGQITSGTYNNNETLFRDTFCVAENACLDLVFADTQGDGICCAFGQGYFNVYLDGELAIEGDGNYQTGTTINLACSLGETCSTAILLVSEGLQTAPMEDAWYVFIPDTSGQFSINTCDLGNNCNTGIWIYDYCIGLNWNNTPQGSIYFGGNGCNDDSNADALLNANLLAGKTYYLRIGSKNNSCDSSIEWQINYNGPAVGCTDVSACNFDSNAEIMGLDSCIYPGDPECPEGPDLTIFEGVLKSSVFIQLKDNDDACFIEENCVTGYGQRELLRFTTHIENIGEQDFYIGYPPASVEEATDQWEWDPCHGHWHYEGYAEYILYDEDKQPIPVGFKNGFCVMDLDCSYGGGTPKYGCGNQGITAHCGDIYDASLDCQWIDITNIPNANYTLVVRINWDQSPDAAGRVETNFVNNWAQACIRIYTDGNGGRSVDIEEECLTYLDCSGEIYGNAVYDCNGDCGGLAQKGDINSDQELSSQDLSTYMDFSLSEEVSSLLSPCFDLNEDQKINVTDAALALACTIQNGEATGGIDYCEFPYTVTNPFDTVALRVGNVNLLNKYLEVEMSNPDGKVMAFQFSIDGIEIDTVQATEVFDNLDFTFKHGTNEIIGIASDMSPLSKNEAYYPILRVYYGGEQTIDSEACMGSITAIVNELREETITKYDATCKSILPWATGVEEMPLPNLQVSPNPFSELTTFHFGKNISGTLELTNVKGKLLRTLQLKNQHTLTLKRNELISGIYLYQIKGIDFTQSGKLIVK